MTTKDNDVENALFSLFSSLGTLKNSSAAASDAATIIQSLHEKLEGPSGVIHFLLNRLWLPVDKSQDLVQGDNALSVLVHLVEARPSEYISLTSSAVRRYIEHEFTAASSEGSNDETSNGVSDALLLALAKLLIGPGTATDASASLLALCCWDSDHNNHCGLIAQRVLSTIDTLWFHLRRQGEQQRRKSSCAQMRISALMINICLLGEAEMSLALSNGKNNNNDGNTQSIMDKLLQTALNHPNDDPLLQVSALDQLECLTVHDNSHHPMTLARANFLLSSDILRRGLLCLVGRTGDLSMDADIRDEEWGEADPINGGAALRVLTEICRVGVASSVSIGEATRNKFQLLLSSFQKALHNFCPQGELERLSYIYAVSSLIASCAMVASSKLSAADVANTILSDTALLHEWLGLASRVSQPKLKSAVLCSLSQVMEPSIWSNTTTTRPSDSIVLQLYQEFSRANHERDTTELIFASAKSPFVEERLGAYNVLRALVMRGVGVRLLLLYDDGSGNGNGSSFLDWLLNQELESTKEGKEARYQIVDSILSHNSELIGGLLPVRALRQLEEWKRKGPNFMTVVPWEMATE